MSGCTCDIIVCLFCFFFFKQKTAYEMRISDWSSDVCSSDLTDVEDAPQLGVDLLQVVEIGVLPVQRMAGGRVEAAFSHGRSPEITRGASDRLQIGRASCRERVCQYV